MRHVQPQPEPADFDSRVRKPGLADPSQPYWRRCHDELYKAYGGYCAYLAVKVPRSPDETEVGGSSIDHFLPRRLYPELAFEWSNYRLSSTYINRTKKDKIGILAPFCIEDNYFFINILSGEIFPNPKLSHDLQKNIEKTIKELGLNKKGFCKYRFKLLNEIDADILREESPFLFEEAIRLKILKNSSESSNE